MNTDKLFYRIFLNQPSLISELLPGIPPDCEFDYSAPVVKEKEVRLDGLLTPVSPDVSLPLVFLEAQMQPDNEFYGRYFTGIFVYSVSHVYQVMPSPQTPLPERERGFERIPHQSGKRCICFNIKLPDRGRDY